MRVAAGLLMLTSTRAGLNTEINQTATAASAPCSCLQPSKLCNGCPGDFDSYVLEQSWQPEFCHGHGAQFPGCVTHNSSAYMVDHLTLHGLWPQYSAARSGSSYPFNCTAEKFDPAALDKVRGGRAALIEYCKSPSQSSACACSFLGLS